MIFCKAKTNPGMSQTEENKIFSEAMLVPKAEVKKATSFKNTFQRYNCYKPRDRKYK
jgi:hypothetical protein